MDHTIWLLALAALILVLDINKMLVSRYKTAYYRQKLRSQSTFWDLAGLKMHVKSEYSIANEYDKRAKNILVDIDSMDKIKYFWQCK